MFGKEACFALLGRKIDLIKHLELPIIWQNNLICHELFNHNFVYHREIRAYTHQYKYHKYVTVVDVMLKNKDVHLEGVIQLCGKIIYLL